MSPPKIKVRSRHMRNVSSRNSPPARLRHSPFKLVDYSDPSSPVCVSDILALNDGNSEQSKLLIKHVCESSKLNCPPPAICPEKKSPIKSAIEGLTELQRAEHFEFCMKLSCENKITPKNAFALHLIDYFHDVIKKMKGDTNFQMASMTLAVSTRIYAVRVDTLHAETKKMASGLHSTKMDKTDDQKKTCIDEDPDLHIEEIQTKAKGKKPKKAKRYLLPGTEKSLDTVLDLTDEPHEKFNAVKDIFDATKVGGLMYTCSIIDDSKFQIPLSEAYPYFRVKTGNMFFKTTSRTDDVTPGGLEPVFGLFPSVSKRDVSIVRALEDFSFSSVKWPLEVDGSVLATSTEDGLAIEELANMFEEKCLVSEGDTGVEPEKRTVHTTFDDMFHTMCVIEGPDGERDEATFDAGHEEPNFSPYRTTPPSGRIPGTSQGNKNPNLFKTPTPRRLSNKGFTQLMLSGSALKSFRNSFLHPPSPCPPGRTVKELIDPLFTVGCIDDIINATLTGRSVKVKKKIRKIGTPIKRPKQTRIDFEQAIDKFKKKVLRGKRNHFTQKVKQWSTADRLLPDVSFARRDFYTTFSMGVTAFQMAIFEEWMSRSSGYDHVHVCSSDGDDSGDHNEIVPYQADEHNDHNDFDLCLESLEDLHLVPLPELVKKDTVRFAKFSKNIDQKRVKATIFNILSYYLLPAKDEEHSENQELSQNEENFTDEEENCNHTLAAIEGGGSDVLQFSTMYGKLNDTLPPALREKMSIPIAFVALLHLANEKNLLLESNEDMSDIAISLDGNTCPL